METIIATFFGTLTFIILLGGFINANDNEKGVIIATTLLTSFTIVMILIIFNTIN